MQTPRLALALIVWQRPNVLLLDEPTNHLDLEMRHALTLALQEYQGALVVVSHERHLLKACCDDFLLVADGAAKPFNGDLDDYAVWLREWRSLREVKPEPKKDRVAAPAAADAKKEVAAGKEVRKALEKAEKRLSAAQARQHELDGALADSAIYAPARKDELERLLSEKSRLDTEVAQAEEEWLAASEAMESAGS